MSARTASLKIRWAADPNSSPPSQRMRRRGVDVRRAGPADRGEAVRRESVDPHNPRLKTQTCHPPQNRLKRRRSKIKPSLLFDLHFQILNSRLFISYLTTFAASYRKFRGKVVECEAVERRTGQRNSIGKDAPNDEKGSFSGKAMGRVFRSLRDICFVYVRCRRTCYG